LYGGGGNDEAWGGSDADQLHGNGGNDRLWGGNGADYLGGAHGNDDLSGDSGADTLFGGPGADRFPFASGDTRLLAQAQDTITEFSAAAHDRIDLSAMDAIQGGADNAFVWVGSQPFTALGQVRWQRAGADVLVHGNDTGSTAPDFAILLRGVSSLEAGDL